MKTLKTLFTIAIMAVASTFSAHAQMIDQTNLDTYVKTQYGTDWKQIANTRMNNVNLDGTGSITLVRDIDAPNMSKNDLYLEMANWFVCNYDNALQFADKEQGVIIARPYVENLVKYNKGFSAYDISIMPTIRAQVKDGKVRVTYTLQDYKVKVDEMGGRASKGLLIGTLCAAATAATIDAVTPHHETVVVDHYDHFGPRGHHGYYGPHHVTHVTRIYHPHHYVDDALLATCIADAALLTPAEDCQTWSLSSCAPFAAKDKHRKASTKAFVMANAYAQVVVNNIQAAIQQCNLAANF